MKEFEYEVKFYGNQWVINILCYHEQDNEQGDAEIIRWAKAVADQDGLVIPDYHEVSIQKTGEIK